MPFVQRVVQPKYLSRTTLFEEDGRPKVTDGELEAVTNNTLCNALRQLASLALAANDIFVDLTKQLQQVGRRSEALKGKIGALEGKVTAFDPKKVSVPVSDICTFALRKDHYHARHDMDTSLFSSTSRPRAVQALYEAAAKTPIPLMRQMDRWRRDGHRSSRFFVCTPVLGGKRRKIRNRVDIDIETRLPAAVEELRRWTSTEALGDITVAPACPNRIAPNTTTFSDGNATDGTIASDDEAIDHKLPSPEEQVQVIALKFPAEIVAVDVSGRAFSRMSVQRRSLLHASSRTEEGGTAQRRQTRPRKPRNRRRNTLAGTDQKEIQSALTAGEEPSTSTAEPDFPETGVVFRSKSSEPLRTSPKREASLDTKKSHFYTLKQWGKNRLKMINKSSEKSESKSEDPEVNIYETVTVKRKRSFSRDKRTVHERKPSYSSSEKSSINLPISTPLSAAMSIAVKLRESSAQRRLRRSGGNKDEPHSSSGNWSASSESGRASIGSEIQPKSSATTSSNSLNQHPPSSVNSRRKFNVNTSGSSSVTSEGSTLTPDIHDFHEDGETSSVYSCDTEGYYTSFHMDSGLKTLKEEDTPPTPLHSTTAFSNSSSSNTVLTAENEYELFGKGSTSTTASSAGTVCTTLKATGSSRSLSVGPAVPERKSSLKDKSPGSSLEREFGSEKTGTVKRSPASSKAIVVALVHQQTNGDVSPDSGHNTSSSPIESANSPNGIRSGSEFEFSECSDMEGPDRIERIRVKTTINSSRIPSMCVITPPHSDDESVSHKNEWKRSLNLPLKPLETDLDNLEFADSEGEDPKRVQIINVNPQTGYATLEKINPLHNSSEKVNSSVRAPSPSGGSLTIKEEPKIEVKQTHPIFKSTLLPLNNVFGRLKSNFKRERICIKSENVPDDPGDYVTIADVRNNNVKPEVAASKTEYMRPEVVATTPKLSRNTEYVSLNELPCNDGHLSNDSLERRRRQGARVTLDAEGKVVYSSDSLKRRKGHSTFEPGPYVKEETPQSPLAAHRIKQVRPVNDSRPLSPQEKVVIKAASGMSSPTAEIVRMPPSTIVAPTIRPISPKSRGGAYVHMHRGSLSPEKEPVFSPEPSNSWTMEKQIRRPLDPYGYHNPLLESNLHYLPDGGLLSNGIPAYRTLPTRKSQFPRENLINDRPITPDIMRGLPHDQYNANVYSSSPESYRKLPPRQYDILRLGIPHTVPRYHQVPSLQQLPNNSSTKGTLDDSLKISPIDPRHVGGFQSSTPTAKEMKAAVNLESKLLSPKKSTMSSEELYAVIHKGKKKLNVQVEESSSPVRCTTPENRVKSPETGYLKEKARSRFSWSPSDGEFVEYNTNIDKLSPSPEAGTRQSWACNDRKSQQTSRLDFKKLLLQHSVKTVVSPSSKKLSAVEQLKLSKEQQAQTKAPEMSILELSGSPRNLQNRRQMNLPGSPKNGDKRPLPKLLSPRSQWRFANPRSDVLSSTILEDEDETSRRSSSPKEDSVFRPKFDNRSQSPNPRQNLFDNRSQSPKPKHNLGDNRNQSPKPSQTPRTSSLSQYLKAQRDQFFNSSPKSSFTKENKANLSPPTLETAF